MNGDVRGSSLRLRVRPSAVMALLIVAWRQIEQPVADSTNSHFSIHISQFAITFSCKTSH
jgi:hypothetical protein